jgi:hypothetical protein
MYGLKGDVLFASEKQLVVEKSFYKKFSTVFIHVYFAETITHDLLKTKRSELRLYCDLLVQQIHSVKMVATQKESIDEEVCKPIALTNYHKLKCCII